MSESDDGDDDGVAGSSSDGDDVVGSSSHDSDHAPGRRRARPARRTGLAVFLLVVSGSALFLSWAPLGVPPHHCCEPPAFDQLLGVALGRWHVTEHSYSDESRYMESLAMRHCWAHTLFGHLWYTAEACVSLLEPWCIPADVRDPMRILNLAKDCVACYHGMHGPLGSLVQPLLEAGGYLLHSVPMRRELAAALLDERWHIFHALPLTGRTDSKQLLGTVPNRQDLRKLRDEFRERTVPRIERRSHVRRSGNSQTPVDDIVNWLFATRTMGDLQKAEEAKRDWVRVFVSDPLERERLCSGASHVRRDTLRRARVRADCVAMLLTRAWLMMLNWDDVYIGVWCDGSPQYRGHELFASSIDVMWAGGFKRILLPIVSLSRCNLGAQGIS
jgi:hypothetical protein